MRRSPYTSEFIEILKDLWRDDRAFRWVVVISGFVVLLFFIAEVGS